MLFSRCCMQQRVPTTERRIPETQWPQGIIWLPFGVTRGLSIRREWPRLSSVRHPCIYMRNLSGIRNDVGSDRRPTWSSGHDRSLPFADDGRRDGGRREKFNHETFMRSGVLTIRRQIAKRRRSEIIRNLQLTGSGRDADGAATTARDGGKCRGRTVTDGPEWSVAERPTRVGWAFVDWYNILGLLCAQETEITRDISCDEQYAAVVWSSNQRLIRRTM